MIARRIATLVTTLLTFAGLGACGSATTLEARHNEPVAIAPGSASSARTTVREIRAATHAAAGVSHLPSAFRLPPGSQATTLSDHDHGPPFTLTRLRPEAVLGFHQPEALGGAFTVVADRAGSAPT